jgi:hypothetical protein
MSLKKFGFGRKNILEIMESRVVFRGKLTKIMKFFFTDPDFDRKRGRFSLKSG